MAYAIWALFREMWLPMKWHDKRIADLDRIVERADARVAQLERENEQLRRLLNQHGGLIERTVDVVAERRTDIRSTS